MQDSLIEIVKRGYTIKSNITGTNSQNGLCSKKGENYFYKVASCEAISQELFGYGLFEKYNKVPKIIEIIEDKKNCISIIIFERIVSINFNQGLVCDLLNSPKKINVTEIMHPFSAYFECFQYKGSTKDNYQYKKFFKDRVGRLRTNFIEIDSNQALVIKNTKHFIKNFIPKRTGNLSHGDPSDMNFCSNGMFLDFEETNFNDLRVDFAIIFWSLFLGGAYLFPKYEIQKYVHHKRVYQNQIIKNKFGMIEAILVRKQRIELIDCIVDKFKENLILYKYKNLENSIFYLLVFRMFSVIEFSFLDKNDRIFLTSILKELIIKLEESHDIFITLKQINHSFFRSE